MADRSAPSPQDEQEKLERQKAEVRGKIAEQVASDYLLCNGYVIRERNWKNSRQKNEIDIIAQKGDTVVFVEVKCRSTVNNDPIDAVDRTKILKMTRAADAYLSGFARPVYYRFDIIGFKGEPSVQTMTHLEDAFIAPLAGTIRQKK